MEVLFDGNPIAVAYVGASAINGSNDDLLLGRRDPLDGRDLSMDGLLDEIAVWSRALSDDEIRALHDGGGARLTPGSGTLDGVTLNADVTVPDGGSLTVKNGLALNGALTLASAGNAADLCFSGTQTLTGTGQVVFGGTSASGGPESAVAGSGQPHDADGGAGISIYGGGQVSGGAADTLVNQGTITADVPGRPLQLSMGAVINQGTIHAIGGTLTVVPRCPSMPLAGSPVPAPARSRSAATCWAILKTPAFTLHRVRSC